MRPLGRDARTPRAGPGCGACPRSRSGRPSPAPRAPGARGRPGSRSAWPRARAGPRPLRRSRPCRRAAAVAVGHLAHLELVAHLHAPSARTSRPRSATTLRAAAPAEGDPPRLEPGDPQHGEVGREKGHVDREPQPGRVHGARPVECSAPSHPAAPAQRRRRSAGESAISSAHTTSPSRSSQPDRIGRRGYRTRPARSPSRHVRPHVEANSQAQAQDEEEGQPRQEAELRPRLTPTLTASGVTARAPHSYPFQATPRCAPARRTAWSARPR